MEIIESLYWSNID